MNPLPPRGLSVGVISDTHLPSAGRLSPAIYEAFQGVHLVLHAGDMVSLSVLEDLGSIAPVKAVAGNMDPPDVRRAHPPTRIVKAGGHRIGLVHGAGLTAGLPWGVLNIFEDVSAVVFGHTHEPLLRRIGEVLLVNPGSAAERSGTGRPSVARLHLGEEVTGEIVYLK